MTTSRLSRLLAGLACATGLAASTARADAGAADARAAYDHYDPVRLNERAAAYVREGRYANARILLERAARLAPFDARVAQNLRVLKAHEAGERSVPAASPEPPAAPAAAPPKAPLPEPPPLWPARPEAR